ncbi:hypothetical protein QCA50_016366 [Cerrena zonata]|uniref:MYND-type domain-containing protein n=1 Tax=Cerrena zonata TaxID=2478898 RepID=A0AAW0FNI7_9APHY
MGRATIKEGAIEIAYGWDHITGYFLSVTDKRLFVDQGASEDVNTVVRKVTNMAGYFDLHTARMGGIGQTVLLKTILVFWKRYGVPETHIHRARLGQGVPGPEMELDGQACVVCGQPTLLRCSKCRGIYACDKEHAKKGWKIHKPKCKAPDESTMLAPAASKVSIKVVKGYLLPLEEPIPRIVDIEVNARENLDHSLDTKTFIGDGVIQNFFITRGGDLWSQGCTGPRIEIMFRKAFPCTGSSLNFCVLGMTKGQGPNMWTVPLLLMKLPDEEKRQYVDVDEEALRALKIFLNKPRTR